jgi:hypothetical protein
MSDDARYSRNYPSKSLMAEYVRPYGQPSSGGKPKGFIDGTTVRIPSESCASRCQSVFRECSGGRACCAGKRDECLQSQAQCLRNC